MLLYIILPTSQPYMLTYKHMLFLGFFPENFVIGLFSAHNYCFCLKIAITMMIVGSKHDFKGRGDIRVLNIKWNLEQSSLLKRSQLRNSKLLDLLFYPLLQLLALPECLNLKQNFIKICSETRYFCQVIDKVRI